MDPNQNVYEQNNMGNAPPQGSSEPLIAPVPPNAPSYTPQVPPQQQPMYQPPPQVQPVIQPIQPVIQPVVQPVVVQPQPVVSGAIVINQTSPVYLPRFGTIPTSMVCPYCQRQIFTAVEKTFNMGACCIFCWFGIFYCIIQAIRGKEMCCEDATHKCPLCQRVVGTYTAC